MSKKADKRNELLTKIAGQLRDPRTCVAGRGRKGCVREHGMSPRLAYDALAQYWTDAERAVAWRCADDLGSRGSVRVVCASNGTPLGAAAYEWAVRADAAERRTTPAVHWVWARPGYRGIGIGGRLVWALLTDNAGDAGLAAEPRLVMAEFGGRGHPGELMPGSATERLVLSYGIPYVPSAPATIPFVPVLRWSYRWLSGAVRELLRVAPSAVYAPVLADALQEAGCENVPLLRGLRGGGAGYAVRWVYQRARSDGATVGLDGERH